MAAKKKVVRRRSAETGRMVTEKHAKSNPATTVRERVRSPSNAYRELQKRFTRLAGDVREALRLLRRGFVVAARIKLANAGRK